MSKLARQFDPNELISSALGDLDAAMNQAAATIQRIGRLKDRLAAEIDAVRAEREAMAIFTEAEAADLLKLKPAHLADLRRKHDLPHVNFGNVIRYTKPQLHSICDRLALNNRQNQDSASRRRAA